jgi:predicted Zn finger-like uncharacterized protein
MRIVCPSCSAAYDVPDGLLAGRKAVRCARCGQDWHPAELPPAEPFAPSPPPAAQVAETVASPPEIAMPARPVLAGPPVERRPVPVGASAIDRLMTPPPRPAASLALRLGWIGSVALVMVLLYGAYVWRADVMAAWPPSVRLYAALGLARINH